VYEHLSERLKESGYDLVVITNEVESAAATPTGFRLIVEPFGFVRYRAAIDRIEPDIVMFFLHARDVMVWPLLLMLRMRGTQVIYWNHGINLQAPDNVIKRLVFGLFHRMADAIVLYSVNEKRYIAQKHLQKLFVANNTINFDSIPDIPESKDEIRQQLDIPFDKVVLFVGRVTASKRLDDLLVAATELKQGIGVIVVGDGLTAEQARAISSADNIMHLGPVYDPKAVNRVFKMADVFSIPGKVGLGLNQAFFWGLPIVTEDVRHSPEIVYAKDGVNGFIVEKHNPRMLAEKINLLLSSDELYRQFSDAARHEIRTNANIDKMCDGFIKAIEFLEQGNDAG